MNIGQSTKDLYSKIIEKKKFKEAAARHFKRAYGSINNNWVTNQCIPSNEIESFYKFTLEWAKKEIKERQRFIKRNEMTVNALEKEVEYQEVKP